MASKLLPAMLEAGLPVEAIWSRNRSKAEALALSGIEAKSTAGSGKAVRVLDELEEAAVEDTLCLLAVSDDAIAEVAGRLGAAEVFALALAHTSGSVDAMALALYAQQYGCFYPLQTFTESQKPDFAAIPFCLTGSDESVLSGLEMMAVALGAPLGHIHRLSDLQRRELHLAAVFANNFSNRCFALAAELLEKSNLSFDLLKPLIADTARNAIEVDPRKVQTGPAARGDAATIARHQRQLQQNPELRRLYDLLTASIQGMRAPEDDPKKS